MTNQQVKPQEGWDMCSEGERFPKPDTSTSDPSNANVPGNAEPEATLPGYESDERWIASNEKYFRRSQVFAAWRKLDQQIARTIATDILKFIWAGGIMGDYVLDIADVTDSRTDDASVQFVDLPNYDTSRPAGCQYLWPHALSACRRQNIEKQIRIWLEYFDWELSYLRLYHESGDLKCVWEVKLPNDWAEQKQSLE